MSASAKNMEAICKAKAAHDAECPWQKPGERVCLNPFDVERMGWEDGDTIAGLILVADATVTTGMMRVECEGDTLGGEPELADAVSSDRLVTA